MIEEDVRDSNDGPSGAHSALDRLMAVIESRRRDRPAGSYVAQLFDRGCVAIGDKVLEEAAEAVAAAKETGTAAKQHQIHEFADLLFHTLVLMAETGVRLEQIEIELNRRSGTSGLAEKAARNGGPA